MNICVIIPAHNEERTIASLINDIRGRGFDTLVVDDGSTDTTAEQVRAVAGNLIRHDINKGKGLALRSGFDFAVQNHYDAVMAMDGDGQHAPEDIINFINAHRASSADVIVGNRMQTTANMPLARFFTNKLMSYILSKFCHQVIPDSQCGFRFITCRALRTFSLFTSNFEIESEILIEASRNGFRIESIPTKTIYQDETSKISPLVDTMRFIVFMFRKIWTLRH